MGIKVIITGATGMVGEGVLLECLDNPAVGAVLMMNRRHYNAAHPKLTEIIVPDFFQLDAFANQLTGYDACFFCAGISSFGMKEDAYTRITYDTTIQVARKLAMLNPAMIFNYVSGAHTDSTEKGRIMWARVKGKTENALMRLPFKKTFNFRPGLMKPLPAQKNIKGLYKLLSALYPLLSRIFPKGSSTLREVALAMIHSVTKGYPAQVLEVSDIKSLAKL